MSIRIVQYLAIRNLGRSLLPLEVIRPGILVFSLRTEWTDVAWRLMDQAMPDHFVFSLEPFTAFRTAAGLDWAIMWPNLRMYVHVRAGVGVSMELFKVRKMLK